MYFRPNKKILTLVTCLALIAAALFIKLQPVAHAQSTSQMIAYCDKYAADNGGSLVVQERNKTGCRAGYSSFRQGDPISKCTTDACKAGWRQAERDKNAASSSSSSSSSTSTANSQEAKDACSDYAPGGSKHNNTYFDDCTKGYADGAAGKTKADACTNKYVNGSESEKACLVGFTSGAASRNDDTSACVANGGTTLEWIACPVITSLSKAAEGINGSIEDQLQFNTSEFLPDKGDNAGVHKAWNIIKDIVSVIMVIVLLIMVIAQASGGGPFEAYTIRKILPRVVIAIIAMQLSWDLAKFLIDIANDLGEGIKQIMTAPFGGGGNLDLGSLLHHLGNGWAALTSFSLTAALVATPFLAVSNPAGAVLVVFTIILAVLIALATILFRNILIITLVIFAPLALLLWVLPNQGLQKYWKLYSDNFIKLLLLFPLMIAIIYSGRIFAYIAGGVGGFLALIIVMVGFFGPYFFLPQAFKWGGSILSSASNSINKGGDFLGKKPKEYLNARKEEYAKERKRQSQERVSEGRPSFIRGDHFRSGKLDPLYGIGGGTGRRLREAKIAGYEAGGAASFEEENKQYEQAIEAREKGLNERIDKQYAYVDRNGNDTTNIDEAVKNQDGSYKTGSLLLSGDKDDLVQAIASKNMKTKFRMVDGNELTVGDMFGKVDDAHIEAALGRMAALGGNPNLTALNREVMTTMEEVEQAEKDGTANEPEIAEKNRRLNRFLGRTAGNMFGKMPHWYKGIGGAASGLNAQQLAGVSGASMRQMIETLERDTKSPDKDTSEKASKNLAALVRTWDDAIKNPNVVAGIDKNAIISMGKFLQPANLDSIKGRVIESDVDVKVRQDTSDALERLSQRITPGGDIRDAPRAASEAQEPQTSPPSGIGQAPQGATQAPAGGQQQQGAPTGTGAVTGNTGGGAAREAGAGVGAPAAPFTPGELTAAMREAINTSEFGQRPPSAPLEGGVDLRSHGPETRGTGAKFEGSSLFTPQERRTRAQDDDEDNS